MTDQQDNDVKETHEGDYQGSGELLAQARTAKELKPEDVATALRITPAYVLALESEAYDSLPGPTFIRGYIRSYARFLGLDEDLVISRYAQTQSAEEQVSRLLKDGPNLDGRRRQSKLLGWISLIILAAVVGLSVVWWQDGQLARKQAAIAEPVTEVIAEAVEDGSDESALAAEPVTDDVSEPEQQDEPVDDIPVVATGAAEVLAIVADVSPEAVIVSPVEEVTGDVTNQNIVAVAVDAAGAIEETPLSEGSVAPVKDELYIRFVAECWLEIRDVTNKVIFSDVRNVGDELRLSGDGPFQVVLGDARAVAELRYNNEPVAVAEPQSDSNIARLKLG